LWIERQFGGAVARCREATRQVIGKYTPTQHPLGNVLRFTLLVGAVPFVLYAGSRMAGLLPSQAEWQARVGGNHGPWCYEWQNVVLEVCWLGLAAALPLWTGGQSIVAAMQSRKVTPILRGMALTLLQWAMAFGSVWLAAWTID
jgi:hypothetical protein